MCEIILHINHIDKKGVGGGKHILHLSLILENYGGLWNVVEEKYCNRNTRDEGMKNY